MGYKVGIDVGGTFTDFLLVDDKGNAEIYKVASTPVDPSLATINGLIEMARAKQLELKDFLPQVDIIVHGTTITTNAILTGKYAKTGFITTKGFRDLLNNRRGKKRQQYEAKEAPPPPLVPRPLIRVIEERIDCEGNELIPLKEEDVYSAIEIFKREQVEAIAVSFLFSFFNPSHEKRVSQILEKALPEVYISLSCEVLPQVRVYERSSTTVLNACVGPSLKAYIESLLERLKRDNFAGALLIMQSNGGVMSPEVALRFASNTLLSGPAGGPKAGIFYGGIHGLSNIITVDMGGTSFDACLIRDGAPRVTTEVEVSEYRIASQSLAINTIGAGGGSIAWIDPGGILRVGPKSAGADPGPACYGIGGEEPTVTDTDLVLGYLNPDYFLGGKTKLDYGRAEKVIKEKIAQPLNLDLFKAASGIYNIVNSTMAQGVRLVSVSQGVDPREFALIIAGGAGPIHGGMIAKELEIPLLLVPRESSVFCATGMLISDLRHDMVRSFYMPLIEAAVNIARMNTLFKEMYDVGYNTLKAEGIPEERMKFSYSADLRYIGQHNEIEISLPMRNGTFTKEDIATALKNFHKHHDLLYGYSMIQSPVESVNLRVSAEGLTDKPAFRESPFGGEDASDAIKAWREIFLEGNWIKVPIYDGTKMCHGNKVSGPAIIEEPTTTILITTDYDLTCDRYSNYVMHPKGLTMEETIRKLKQR